MIDTTTLWRKNNGSLSVHFGIATMSNHRQSYFIHSDRTLHARTRTWLPLRPSEKQWPNKVLKFDWRPGQLHLYISWHGRFMLHVGRNCSRTSCVYVLRDGLKRQARIRPFFPEGCQSLLSHRLVHWRNISVSQLIAKRLDFSRFLHEREHTCQHSARANPHT